MIKGIDCNHWEGTIDWKLVKDADIKFAILKASENIWIDVAFINNWNKLKEYDILRGAYHYFRPTYDSVAQAKFFYNLAKDTQLPPFIDLELYVKYEDDLNYYTNTPKKDIRYKIRTFLEMVGKLFDRAPIVYTSKGFWDQYLGDNDWAKSYRLWVANYEVTTPKLPRDWTDYLFWQYTAKGRIPGIYADVDMNYFNGTLEELYTLGSYTPLPPPPDDGGNTGNCLKKAEILTAKLRLRDAPTTSASVIGYLYQGDQPEIIEKRDIKVETRIDTWVRCGFKQWFAMVHGGQVYAREL